MMEEKIAVSSNFQEKKNRYFAKNPSYFKGSFFSKP